jgi:hypothetical protein
MKPEDFFRKFESYKLPIKLLWVDNDPATDTPLGIAIKSWLRVFDLPKNGKLKFCAQSEAESMLANDVYSLAIVDCDLFYHGAPNVNPLVKSPGRYTVERIRGSDFCYSKIPIIFTTNDIDELILKNCDHATKEDRHELEKIVSEVVGLTKLMRNFTEYVGRYSR